MLKEGTVLLLDGSGPIRAAVALGIENALVSALTDQGRQKLRVEKILRASEHTVVVAGRPPEQTLAEARSYVESVLALAAGADLEGLWEVVSESEAAHPLSELTELCYGSRTPQHTDAMAVALIQDRTYFKARREGFLPNPARTVSSMRQQQTSLANKAREEEELAQALRDYLAHHRGAPPVGPQRTALDILRDHALVPTDHHKGARCAALLERAFPERREPTPLLAFLLLVEAGLWSPDENLDIHRHRVSTAFSAEVRAQAERWAQGLLEDTISRELARGRTDARDLRIWAIDDATTTDVDDALRADRLADGRVRVHVVIADASEIAAPGSLLEAEARHRGATLYLPDRTIPMLPPEVSEHAASLTAGADRLAIDFAFTVGVDGELSDFEAREIVCTLTSRLTYEEVDALLAAPDGSEVSCQLQLLAEAAQRTRARRLSAGAVVLQQAEVKIRVTEEGEILVRKLDVSAPSRELVAEMMIATGGQMGQFCWRAGVAAVYRFQEGPEEPIPYDPQKARDPKWVLDSLMRMRRAELSSEPRRHYGLGLDAYIQVTSPIRRYQDLAMHAQLKGYLRTGVAPLGQREVLDVFAEVESTAYTFTRMERDAKRYWIIRWLESRIGTAWRAVVIRPAGPRWNILVPDLGIQESAAVSRNVEPGDWIEVVVKLADARRDRLLFEA